MNLKLGDIATQFQLECRGDVERVVSGIANLQEANSEQLAFLFNSSYKHLLATTQAAAVVLRPEDAAAACTRPVLLTPTPRKAQAAIAALFDNLPPAPPGIDPSAHISAQAEVGANVSIGAGVVIAPGARIGAHVIIGAGCQIGAGTVLGAASRLFPNVVLYHDVQLGEGCIIHSGAVLGADGFGFEIDLEDAAIIKIPQVYGVRIGKDVEIGAGTTIDRGALNHTRIGAHCKLDNQVQVGHGTVIGEQTLISGCTAIAGSTRIGSHCLIGGASGIIDNIEIVDHVEITAMTLVSRSILKKGRYSSGTGLMSNKEWKRNIVGFSKLATILKRIRRLETHKQPSTGTPHGSR